MIGALTKDEINSLLSSQTVGHLAYADGLYPFVVPVSYKFDGKNIIGQMNEGNKLKIIRNNLNVCLEVSIITDIYNWKCVVISGKFLELTGEDYNAAKDSFFNDYFTLKTETKVHSFEHETTAFVEDANRLKAIMYKININKISSRYEKQ